MTRLLLVPLIALFLAAPAPAQPAEGVPEQPRQAPEPEVTINFKGGTVADFIAAIRAAAKPNPVNITTSEDAARTPLPAIQLDRVPIGTAVSAIEFVVQRDNRSHWYINRIPGSGTPAYAVHVTRNRPDNPLSGEAPRHLRVFSVRELIEPPADEPGARALPIDTVLTAVQQTLALAGGAPEPDIKFHEDSSLLLIHAAPDQVSAVSELIEQMRDDLRKQRSFEHSARERRRETGFMLRRAELNASTADARLSMADQAYQRTKDLAARAVISETEVARAELDLISARNEFEMARIEVERFAAAHEGAAIPAADPAEIDDLRKTVSQLREEIAILRSQKGTDARPRK